MKTIKISALLMLASIGMQAQTDSTAVKKIPFEGMDLTWINGQNRQTNFPLTLNDKDGETILTGVAYVDAYYNYSFHKPKDNTNTISSTMGRSNEFQINMASIGIESNYKNIIGRLWLQYGQMGSIVQDLDGTLGHGRNTSVRKSGNRQTGTFFHFDQREKSQFCVRF